MRNKKRVGIGVNALLTALLTMGSGAAFADTVEIKALATKFEPEIVYIKPGDTVKWTNMAAHDTASVAGMIPEGAQPWQSKMGEDFSVTLDKEGAYVYKCSPHVSLGMTGAVVVGEGKPQNLDQIHSSPENKGMIGRAVKKLDKDLQAKQGQ